MCGFACVCESECSSSEMICSYFLRSPIYTYFYTYVHIYVCTYVFVCVCVCVCVRVCEFENDLREFFTLTCRYVVLRSTIDTNIYIYIGIYKHIKMCI